MPMLIFKYALSAAIVVAVAEIAKRSTLFGALVASLPLTSILAMVWLHHDTGDTQRVSQLSSGIFWLVLPSLVLFLALPWLLNNGLGFYRALALSMGATVVAYGLMTVSLRALGVAV